MTGVPPPPMSMCQRSFAPPSAHLSGSPASGDAPLWAGRRQFSQPVARLPAAAEEVPSPRPESSRPAAATAGNTLIPVALSLAAGAPASFTLYVQADQAAVAIPAVDPVVRQHRTHPGVAVQHGGAGQLGIPFRRRFRDEELAALVERQGLPVRGDQAAIP